MKSLLELWKSVAKDLGDECRVSTTLDIRKVERRVEDEGLSFLTITLPEFGKSLERSLELGYIAPDSFLGFKKRGGLPLFLGGFLEQIFDTRTGEILDTASPQAIFAIRQLAGLCGKVELECSKGRIEAAYDKYIECESHVKASDLLRHPHDLHEFERMGRKLLARVFTRVDGEVAYQRLRPSHGPGATADRLSGNAKYNLAEWTERMDRAFPSSDYLLPNFRFYQLLDRVIMREPGHERPVKVIHVPKTLKTPRIIAMEPTCMMYMQQALWREFKTSIETDPLLGHFIGFSDQMPNRQLARKGSVDGSLATLDLSEASDRVSNQLVQALMKNHPHLNEGVQACRSTTADVLGHGVIPLSKFASMGSALCFPVEAMVFTTIVFLGIQRGTPHQLTMKDIESYIGSVRIYGDDIIVPVEHADNVILMLEHYGLKVNVHKSFQHGSFRESCGGDYFKGYDVTPVRARRELPEGNMDATELIAWVAFRNLAYERGLFRTVRALDERLMKELKGFFPVVPKNSSMLGRWDFSGVSPERISPTLHRPEARGWVASPKRRRNSLNGVGALMKYFLNAGDLPVTDREHLVYSGRPVAVTLKLRWMPV